MSKFTGNDIELDVKERNNLTEDQIIKFAHKYKSFKTNTWTIILETNAKAYYHLMIDKKIYFASNRCRIVNDFNLNICTKCCKYGHSAKKCTFANQPVCLYCAGSHSFTDCKEKTNFKCTNCFSRNQKYNDDRSFEHAANNYKVCGSYQYLLHKAINKTDYPFYPIKD